MSVELQKLCGHPQYRPLVEMIVKLGGLGLAEAKVGDLNDRIDPLELAAQRGARELARKLLNEMGWTMAFMSPVADPKPRQTVALSDGKGE